MDDFASFARLVHEAYAHLYDRAFLQEHPLARRLYGATPSAAERLHRTLVDAIEWLRPLGAAAPSSAERRRYRHLQLRYLEGATPERIARDLLVSARQARRDHGEAVDEVARLLWRRVVGAEPPSAAEPAPPEPAPPVARGPSPRAAGGLDAEISKLAAADAATPAQVEEVIRGVVQTVSRLAEAHGVRVSVDVQQPLAGVGASRTVLRQILLNLLSDAIVRHPGAALQVGASGREGAVDVLVGASRPAAASTPTGTEPTGSAAGPLEGKPEGEAAADALGVTRRLARTQGIELADVPWPGGFAIRLTLPTVATRTLLVVDDNPDVALLFRRYLADPTYRLVQARSAERALRLARELQPDVVFLDVLMPSTDGWEILQALRAEPATASVPVVVCSVLPDRALSLSLGVSDFLPKPVTRAALLEVLARLRRDRAGGREPEERRARP